MKSKQELRKYIKEKRKTLDIDNLSDELVQKLIHTAEFKLAKHVMFFYPMDYEVNLLKIIEEFGQTFISTADTSSLDNEILKKYQLIKL